MPKPLVFNLYQEEDLVLGILKGDEFDNLEEDFKLEVKEVCYTGLKIITGT